MPNSEGGDSGRSKSHDPRRVVIPAKAGTPSLTAALRKAGTPSLTAKSPDTRYPIPDTLTPKLLPLLTLLTLLSLPARAQSPFTDPRDGHQYLTVTIGKQIWMAENLAYLPAVDKVYTGLFEEECHYVYGYDGVNADEARKRAEYQQYGVLYNWVAAKSACPPGWHLPTDGEWMELERFLGMTAEDAAGRDWRSSGDAGTKLKASSGWKQGPGTDAVGFKALPGGCRGYGGFESAGYAAYFWSASTIDGDNGWRRGICSDLPGIARQEDRRYFGYAVRCVKNWAKAP